MNRLDRLSALLRMEAGNAIVNNRPIQFPEPLNRYIGIEQNSFGDPLRVHFGDTLEAITQSLDEYNVKLTARVRVFDLDRGTCFVPVWTVSRFEEAAGPLDHTMVMQPTLVHGIQALMSS